MNAQISCSSRCSIECIPDAVKRLHVSPNVMTNIGLGRLPLGIISICCEQVLLTWFDVNTPSVLSTKEFVCMCSNLFDSNRVSA